MRRPVRLSTAIAATVLLLGAVVAPSALAEGAADRWPTYGPTFQLNAAGGTDGTDGLRITFGGAQLSVQRFINPEEAPDYPNNEVYAPWRNPGDWNAGSVFSQVAMAVGDESSGGTAFITPAFVDQYGDNTYVRIDHLDNVTVKPWNVATSASATQITSLLTGEADGLIYSVAVTITYTSPQDRMKIDYQVSVPAGNTKPVRLYHLIDTYLGGNDAGPGFFTDPTACPGGYSGAVVGVDRADLGVVEAFQYVSGEMWSGYMSAYYSDVVFGENEKTDPDAPESGAHFGPGWMNDLSNQIIADPDNDNGIGIGWNFGTTAGTYSSAAKLIFSSDSVDPCEDTDAIAPTNPDPTEVVDPDIDTNVIDDPFDPLKDEAALVVPKPTG